MRPPRVRDARQASCDICHRRLHWVEPLRGQGCDFGRSRCGRGIFGHCYAPSGFEAPSEPGVVGQRGTYVVARTLHRKMFDHLHILFNRLPEEAILLFVGLRFECSSLQMVFFPWPLVVARGDWRIKREPLRIFIIHILVFWLSAQDDSQHESDTSHLNL